MYNNITQSDVIIDMNGEELVRIKDLDVKVMTLASDSKADIPKEMSRLYISSYFSDEYRLSSLNKMDSAKYVVIGSDATVLFISMILNSSAGYVQMKDFGQNPKINLSAIKNLRLPNMGIHLVAGGAVIDMYEGMLEEVLRKIKEDDEDFLEMMVLRQFLNLIHRYFVEQLYLPEFFEKRQMDIVTPWLNICRSQDEKMPELHNKKKISYLKSLMDTILADEKRIFEVSNKMKVYQMDSHRFLCQLLNPKHLGSLS